MATESDSDEIRVLEGNAVWREIEGEIVLLDLESSVYLGISRVGSLLWEAMTRGTTRDALVDLILQSYIVDRARATADVDAFVAQCRARHLLAP